MYPKYTESGFDIRGLDWARLIEEQEDYLMELLSNNITTEKTHRELFNIMIKITLRDEINVNVRPIVIHDSRKNNISEVLSLMGKDRKKEVFDENLRRFVPIDDY